MIHLAIDDAVRGDIRAADRAELRRRLGRMVRAASLAEPALRELEVAFRLVDDAEIHELNRQFRHKDRPTDVLAFSQREGEGGGLHPDLLGDVVISVDTARRQAREGRRTLLGELCHLAAHGLCHLLGYDHRDDDEERVMNARARRLLAQAAGRGRIVAA